MKTTYESQGKIKGRLNWKLKRALTITALVGGFGVLGYGANYMANTLRSSLFRDRTDFVKEGTYEGYQARIGIDGIARGVAIMVDDYCGLSAKDYNKDGRFDEIHLNRLPKGHPLEKLASPTELEKVYSAIEKQ
ncbi:MAG: hypothetical protein AABY10_05215 [Nanoarchaeota archaeon]